MNIKLSFNEQRHSGVGGFVTRTIVLTLAIIIAIYLLPGVRIAQGGVVAAVLTAVVIALLDNFVRPILIFVTLPFTVVSMGLFIFVINAIIIELTAAIVPPFEVDSFGYALFFSLIVTVLNYLLELPARWLDKPLYKSGDSGDDRFDSYEEVDE